MAITIEQIDELRKRAKVNYSDAKDALEKCDGDILEALVYLEGNHKVKATKKSNFVANIFDKCSDLIRKGSNIRCIMQSRDKTIFSLSLNVVLLITFFLFPFIEFIALALVIALFTGHKIRFENINGEGMKVNDTLNKVYDGVDDLKDKFANSNTTNTESEINNSSKL